MWLNNELLREHSISLFITLNLHLPVSLSPSQTHSLMKWPTPDETRITALLTGLILLLMLQVVQLFSVRSALAVWVLTIGGLLITIVLLLLGTAISARLLHFLRFHTSIDSQHSQHSQHYALQTEQALVPHVHTRHAAHEPAVHPFHTNVEV